MTILAGRTCKAVALLSFALLVAVMVTSCKGGSNKFKQPRFVKEWEVKGGTLRDVTANKNGVFVLVQVRETIKNTPDPRFANWTGPTVYEIGDKMTANMNKYHSKGDQESFNRRWEGISNLEKEYYEFKEKWHEVLYRCYFTVQQYDFNGNPVSQWPVRGNGFSDDQAASNNTEKDATDDYDPYGVSFDGYLASDSDGYLYMVDYGSRKLIKLSASGDVVFSKKFGDGGHDRGFDVSNGKISVIDRSIVSPKYSLIRFATDGKVSRRIEEYVPGTTRDKFKFQDKTVEVMNEAVSVNSIAYDDEGSLYMLVGKNDLYKYDKNMKQKFTFKPVLKNGFDTEVYYYDEQTKKKERYEEEFTKAVALVGGFTSRTVANLGLFGMDMHLYDLDRVYVSPQGEVFVTFVGEKPFGAINAIVYDKRGKMVGYWKSDKKSASEWFDKLNDLGKIKAEERHLGLAFYSNKIYMSKDIALGGSTSYGCVQVFER